MMRQLMLLILSTSCCNIKAVKLVLKIIWGPYYVYHITPLVINSLGANHTYTHTHTHTYTHTHTHLHTHTHTHTYTRTFIYCT